MIEELKDIKAEVRTCYGALSSFQVQLHHLTGIIEETHALTIEALQDISEMDFELKVIKEGLKDDE